MVLFIDRMHLFIFLLVCLLSGPTDLRAQNISTYVWEERTVVSPSSRLARGCMVYDSLRNRLVLYGGFEPGGQVNDLWEWDSIAWRRRTLTTSPTPLSRYRHGMAFDSSRAVTVMFGGFKEVIYDSNGWPIDLLYFDDTWEYDGVNWTQRLPNTVPPARLGHSMAFDSVRNKVVMYGGESPQGAVLNEIWEFDGNDWIHTAADSSWPIYREKTALAFDEARGVTVGAVMLRRLF